MTEGPGISYSWRSIVRGLQALKEGLIWRVGDGSQINIWLDHWVQNVVNRRPITPRGHTILSKVSELIDPISNNRALGQIASTRSVLGGRCEAYSGNPSKL